MERRPRLIVLQPDPEVLATWTESIEAGGHMRVAGVRDPVGVFDLLADTQHQCAGLLLPWPDRDFDPTEFFALMKRANVPEPPIVLAYAPEWPREVAITASRLGVHGFLTAPLSLHDLITEVLTHRRTRRTPSSVRLLGESAATDSVNWRGRMLTLASNVPRQTEGRFEKQLEAVMELLDVQCQGAVTMPVAEALLFYARRDQAQLDLALGDSDAVSLEFVRALHRAVEKHLGSAAEGRAGEARMARMLEGVLQQTSAREGGNKVSSNFLQLRELAGMLFEGGESDREALKDFRTLLGRMLDVMPKFLGAVDAPRLIQIAGQVKGSLSEQFALDCARLSLLAWVLKHRNAGSASSGIDYEELRSIAGMLGGGTGEVDIASRLRTMGQHLAEQADFDPGQLPDLAAFQSMFSDLTNRADPETLRRMGVDPDQLDRSMAALQTVRDAAGPDAKQGGQQRRPPAAKLLGRLALELGLPAAELVKLDGPGLLDRLPTLELGSGLSGGAVARVRMMTLLAAEAGPGSVAHSLVEAFARKYRKNQAMLAALCSALEQTGQDGALGVLQQSMGTEGLARAGNGG